MIIDGIFCMHIFARSIECALDSFERYSMQYPHPVPMYSRSVHSLRIIQPIQVHCITRMPLTTVDVNADLKISLAATISPHRLRLIREEDIFPGINNWNISAIPPLSPAVVWRRPAYWPQIHLSHKPPMSPTMGELKYEIHHKLAWLSTELLKGGTNLRT